MTDVFHVQAVLFDYSGTLFRLEEDDSWFEGMQVDERQVDGHVQAELMRRLTAPTGIFKDMTPGSNVAAGAAPEAYEAWVNRDLEPHLHREAYLHVLRQSGLPDHHAETSAPTFRHATANVRTTMALSEAVAAPDNSSRLSRSGTAAACQSRVVSGCSFASRRYSASSSALASAAVRLSRSRPMAPTRWN